MAVKHVVTAGMGFGGSWWLTTYGFGDLSLNSVDMVAEVSLSNLSGDTDEECGVAFRLVDTSNFLAAYVDDGDNLVHLSKFVAGVETSIATAAWTPADTAEIRVICQADRIRVWVDHVLVIDVEDGWLVYANRAGLFSRSTAVVQFSDFYAQLLSEVA